MGTKGSKMKPHADSARPPVQMEAVKAPKRTALSKSKSRKKKKHKPKDTNTHIECQCIYETKWPLKAETEPEIPKSPMHRRSSNDLHEVIL